MNPIDSPNLTGYAVLPDNGICNMDNTIPELSYRAPQAQPPPHPIHHTTQPHSSITHHNFVGLTYSAGIGEGATHIHSIDYCGPPMEPDGHFRQLCIIPDKHYFHMSNTDDGNTTPLSEPFSRRSSRDAGGQYFCLDGYENDPNLKPGMHSTALAHHRPTSGLGHRGRNTVAGASKSQIHHTEPSYFVLEKPASIQWSFSLNNSQALWGFYEHQFQSCRQHVCKVVSKAWIRIVAPKKQSTHPYTGGDKNPPPWWPEPWGWSKNQRVRHKEPDHLYKSERLYLLIHILRMVMEPTEKQRPDIRHLNLNILSLESAANRSLMGFFMRQENSPHLKSRPLLDDLFRVAKMEERFRHGEIDGATKVDIMEQKQSIMERDDSRDLVSGNEADTFFNCKERTSTAYEKRQHQLHPQNHTSMADATYAAHHDETGISCISSTANIQFPALVGLKQLSPSNTQTDGSHYSIPSHPLEDHIGRSQFHNRNYDFAGTGAHTESQGCMLSNGMQEGSDIHYWNPNFDMLGGVSRYPFD